MQTGDILNYQDRTFTDTLREVDADYIISILKSQITKFWSWGTHAIRTFEYGIRISVNGLKHKGYVWIVLHGSDTFEIYLTDKSNVIIDIHTGIYFDQLVDVIDSAVEYTGASYQQDLSSAGATDLSRL